jgi:hypothetical protein
MRNKTMLIGVIGVVIGVLLSAAVVLAGNMDSPSAPTDPASQMYTMQQIYDRLATGAAGAKMTAFTEPGSGPGTGTMYTLDEIMAKAPVTYTNAATQTQILSGTVAWGLSAGAWGVITGTLSGGGSTYNAAVPKTGQTTCYDTDGNVTACAGTGQDGALLKGVAWPNPRFTNNGNGTVTDNLTGLIWLTNANCWGAVNWATALANANGLANGACGLTDGSVAGDWRLPNRFEMQSLLDLGFSGPAVSNTAGTGKWAENDPFTGVQTFVHYWTSTTSASNTPNAWVVYLNDGGVSSFGRSLNRNVWPVRGGQ